MLDHRIRHGGFLHVGFSVLPTGAALEGFTIIIDDPNLGRNELDFSADEFFTYRYKRGIACFAKTVSFIEGTEAFVVRDILQEFIR